MVNKNTLKKGGVALGAGALLNYIPQIAKAIGNLGYNYGDLGETAYVLSDLFYNPTVNDLAYKLTGQVAGLEGAFDLASLATGLVGLGAIITGLIQKNPDKQK